MGLLSLVFDEAVRVKLETKRPEGLTGPFNPAILEIDATTTMTHDRSSTPTKNPIEDGSDITDHITIDNDRLSIDGVISENPIALIQSVQTILSQRALGLAAEATGISQGLLAGVSGSVGALLFDNNNRPENSFRILEELHRNRLPFKIVTELGKYDNVILLKLSIPQTAREGDSIKFSATFEQIKIVKTLTVTITSADTAHTANKKTDAGSQSSKEAAKSVEVKSSVIFTAIKRARSFFR